MTKPVEDIDIPVPWGHISGKWWGPRDKQPVIALHGWQDNAATFDRLAPLLPNEISLLCIDMIGHGRSSHYPTGYIYYFFWEAVRMLRRIILHFGWTNITLMGHSRGGAIAFIYTAFYTKDIKKLICIDIAYPKLETPENAVENAGEAIDRFLKYETLPQSSMPSYDYAEMIEIVEDAYNGSINTDSAKVLMNRGMRPSKTQRGTFTFTRDLRLKVSSTITMIPKEFSLKFAENIKCDYLNIQANQGNYVNNKLYDDILRIIKDNAKYYEHHKVEGTHHLHLNTPENVSDIISKFLLR
ncbi:putative serine hydrolase [Lycorma delicatula]|uniref:putative serine hydrolase n=1 Tax=Lycorma delicatula TaxID=130591 RepID=UPI003F51135B